MNELHVEKTLVVVPWLDPIVDEVGFDVFSRYAEMFWLPIMGPSALWIQRRIVMGLYYAWRDARTNKRQSTLKDFHNTMARHQHREAWRLIKT